MANAQATRRLLDAGRASRPGVIEALSDIVADAKRASQVIRRLRALFRKEHVDRHPVDVNELVEEVVRLLRHDTERQRISGPPRARRLGCRRSPAIRSSSSRSC